MTNGEMIESYVPARLDRMPWSRWHWLIVVSLGATWILDGLEVTLAGSLGGILTRRETLGLSDAQVGASATFYLAGAVLGALLFGYGTDRLGRKRLFFITVTVYLMATGLTAFSWSFASYAFFRALTGAGIGGEYAAINSAIDELIPARVRGRVDLMINGSYWLGAALGSAATIVLLDPRRLPIWLGWRDAWPGRHFLSPMDSGKSALAHDSWTRCRSRTDHRRSRADNHAASGDAARAHGAADADSHAHSHAVARDLERNRARTSAALVARLCADAGAGVFL